MNKEIKAKWVAALRSGEYKQGCTQLRHENEFCCLGVLCDLHSKEKEIPWSGPMYLGKYGFLPYEVQTWAELDHDYGTMLSIGGKVNTPNYMNDTGKTFTEIADAIEAQL